MRDKIVGTILGTAIGDALGMPVEGYTHDRIVQEHGQITDYKSPAKHKWFKDEKPGTWTDDTQLTLAVAKTLSLFGPTHNDVMESMAAVHVEALKDSTLGWGGSTRNAVRKLANGCPWTESGSSGEGRGKGNGVAMKVAPLAVSLKAMQDRSYDEGQLDKFYEFALQLTLMTHQSEMAAISAFMQITAVNYCLNHSPKSFAPGAFLDAIITSGRLARQMCKVKAPDLSLEDDDLIERMAKLFLYCDGPTSSPAEMAESFDGGGCYVYQSLPMAYAMFIQHSRYDESTESGRKFTENPIGILSLVVSAGGDTDTTGAIVGALCGALFGARSFPSPLIDELYKQQEVLSVAENFARTLGY